MKARFVSAVAMLICCAICAIVIVFGYSRYKASQAQDAAFSAQLRSQKDQPAALATHMPEQLPRNAGGQ
jgi:predicted negative regulator of RcsB-dependent stress response